MNVNLDGVGNVKSRMLAQEFILPFFSPPHWTQTVTNNRITEIYVVASKKKRKTIMNLILTLYVQISLPILQFSNPQTTTSPFLSSGHTGNPNPHLHSLLHNLQYGVPGSKKNGCNPANQHTNTTSVSSHSVSLCCYSITPPTVAMNREIAKTLRGSWGAWRRVVILVRSLVEVDEFYDRECLACWR